MSDLGNSFQTFHLKLQPQIWVYKLLEQAEIGKAPAVLTEAKEQLVWPAFLSFTYSTKYNTSAILLLLTLLFLIFSEFFQIRYSISPLRCWSEKLLLIMKHLVSLNGLSDFHWNCLWSMVLTRAVRLWSFSA